MRRLFTVLLASAALAAAAAIGALAHGGDTTKIHGCVTKETKFLRIVGANDAGKAGETALDWGIAGPQGPPGLSGLEVVEERATASAHGQSVSVASCPSPKLATGGGQIVPASLALLASAPVGVGPVGWFVTVLNGGDSDVSFRAYAICANVAP